jgi:hypothetical protein
MYTDAFIQELIGCEKRITDPPKLIALRQSSSKKEFKMESMDAQYRFGAYIAQNSFFQENFSIGLVYYPKEEKNLLIKMQWCSW